jgi:hypothetical protein
MTEQRNEPSETPTTLAETLVQLAAKAARNAMTEGEWLELMADLGRLQARVRDSVSELAERSGLPPAGKDRLLAYLRINVGRVLDKDELAGVSGIGEWARRIRELRVEDGWPISSDKTRDDLRPGEYVLEHDGRDERIADRWKLANRIRRSPGSGRSRLLAYFQANVNQTLTKDELHYVAKIQEHPRRIRELAEQGWQIASQYEQGDLRPGEYVLTSLERLPLKARQHIKLRYEILERDKFRCADCGSVAGPGVTLQVHHKQLVSQKGTNEPDNLITLCNSCHAGRHALSPDVVADELLHPEAEPQT